MSRISLLLLGPPRLERDGSPIALDTRKAVALLARLALRDTPESRETLTELLWPEFDRSHGRAALRRTLSVLRKGVGDGVLTSEGDTLGIADDADLAFDVADFRGALRAAEQSKDDELSLLERAVALYRGDFLDGFGLRDSAPFDDWQAEQAEALLRELASALERLVSGRRQAGDFDAALGHARRWLALDPLHERVHRTLMRLLSESGRRSEALRQYRVCVRVLEQELGVAPLEETDTLYRAIKEDRLPAPPETAAVAAAPAAWTPTAAAEAAPALIGRAAAWAALEDARSRSRKRRFLLAIEGEAGIGKTTLAEAFLQLLDDNTTAVSARCYPGETQLAYGPFVELLAAALRRPGASGRLAGIEPHWLSETARLAPDLHTLLPELPSPPPLDGPAGRSHLFAGVDRVLTGLLEATNGAVLLLDDVHWADPATLELLAYLSRPGRTPELLLLITLRTDGTDTHQRVLELVAAGEREGLAGRLALERWSLGEVEQLLRETGSQLTAEGAKRLFEETEGLPFFVSEYLSALSQRAGWEELPRGVRELLHSRLGAVPAMERQLLQTAAAIGRSFEFELLHRASGRTAAEVVAGLERLVELDIVREVGGVEGGAIRFDFTHEKMRSLVYDETSLVRRRLLHGRVAEALLGAGLPSQPGTNVASPAGFHLRLAGRDAEAALQFGRAGDHARSLFANPEALRHYRTALALGHPDPAALHEAIGDLEVLAGAYESAIGHFESAAAHGDGGGLGRLEHKLGAVHQRRGAWDAAESHFEAAAAQLDDEADERAWARLLVDRSLNAHRRGRMAEALALAGDALPFAERCDDVQTLAQVHNILGMLARSRGDLASAARALETGLQLTEGRPDPSARIAALNNLALVRADSGDPEAGLTLLAAALDLCRRQGDRHREAALLNNCADLLHAGGRGEEAMERLKEAATIYAAIGKEGGDWQPEIWKLVEW